MKIELSTNELNVLFHSLNLTLLRNDLSPKARKSYQDMYNKIEEIITEL